MGIIQCNIVFLSCCVNDTARHIAKQKKYSPVAISAILQLKAVEAHKFVILKPLNYCRSTYVICFIALQLIFLSLFSGPSTSSLYY